MGHNYANKYPCIEQIFCIIKHGFPNCKNVMITMSIEVKREIFSRAVAITLMGGGGGIFRF